LLETGRGEVYRNVSPGGGCVCACDWDAEFVWTYERREDAVARASRRVTCCECGLPVEAGVEHVLSVFLGITHRGADRPWWRKTARTCAFCWRAVEDFSRCGHCFGGFWRAFEEATGMTRAETFGEVADA